MWLVNASTSLAKFVTSLRRIHPTPLVVLARRYILSPPIVDKSD